MVDGEGGDRMLAYLNSAGPGYVAERSLIYGRDGLMG